MKWPCRILWHRWVALHTQFIHDGTVVLVVLHCTSCGRREARQGPRQDD